MAADERVPLLLDTDIGSDIDDALALAYLLREPRCDLLGVTTVTGDTARRAALVEMLCRSAGRENIPIHAGAQAVMLHGPGQPDVPQYAALANRSHRRDYVPNQSVDFLRAAIRQRPGELTLLGIGPLTNIATLFLLDPEIPALLRRLVLMCGAFGERRRLDTGWMDWNAIVDPVAAAVVMRRARELLCVTLDVTVQCRMEASECRRRLAQGGALLEVVGAMADHDLETQSALWFHDPLAAAAIFAPELCTYERGTVEVLDNLHDPIRVTAWRAHADGPHTIAVGVDVERFFARYFGVVGA